MQVKRPPAVEGEDVPRRLRKPASSTNWEGKQIEGGYIAGQRVGSGSFGDCYIGGGPRGETVCLKIEDARTNSTSRMRAECCFLKELAVGKARRTPNVVGFIQLEQHTIMALELLGPSLEDLFFRCGGKFSVPTVARLAVQFIDCIEHVHSKGILHRDIKPHNFLVGVGEEAGRVFIIDFGLSKRYIDPTTNEHVPFRTNRSLVGTARYVSLAVHKGHEQGRRDDLESVGLVLLHFLIGRLPWQGLRHKDKDKKKKHRRLYEAKVAVPLSTLCHGLPPAFAKYMEYCRALGFDAKPDYDYLRGLFTPLVDPHEDYDWVLKGVHGGKRSETSLGE